ncbi:hypothetical protein HMPREF3086_00745, partial [Dietzia sp. HMSC21D01]|uniref:transposase n=1 Tax=Dietzia sp. HMSC21D01 TaxID=1581054 RepID=UPI0008A274C8
MSSTAYDADFRNQVVARLAELEPQFPSTSAAAEVVAREFGISRDSVRRWSVAAGTWQAHNSSTLRALQAENAALRAQLARVIHGNLR